ncbi:MULTISPECIES: IS4 family transposase [Rhizobium]|uniref:Transposase n=2 Tax=Rhizobium/Agrobacterium group TaxID=227290 RepID=A0A2A6J2S4_9HYPH|nr:IS4 family insertion sequence transposase domain-containing protein [Rhizobium sp. N6212]ANL00071.1 IS4 family insertion sequence transposase domain-containing protein [Rhizobium sp. N621]ANL06200.1 IS4 family insertion sequence transposase domain-containing protein [Rhizobium esperanzae]ANL12365.1 IS4 family insertion sequence transposase domain-containing protein [Rhizobium sp. N1341]ANL24329.1 IS4 family insertion sequence transposase domain-containing protein [Rhizobium sp. N113]ANM0680
MMWARLPDQRFDLLSRVMHDHALIGGSKLRDVVETVRFCDTQTIELRERADRPARQATLCLRFGQATIRRPQNLREEGLPDGVRLSWVEVVEPDAPDGVEPLHWLLLTTHALSSATDAWQIVAWYKQRWMIEQFFRVMKTQGFKIEDSQLQLAPRLEKLVAIAAKAAAIVLQLVQDRSGGDPHPASLAVSPHEINTLAALESRFKGKTKLQSNPHPKASLAWAAWIIAKLGGWNGYASSKPPGPITFFNGLKYCADGWALRDRYMPQSFGGEMFHWIICFWSRTKSSDQRAEPSRWPGSVRACLQVRLRKGVSRAQHRR